MPATMNIYEMTQTWNDAGSVFDAIGMDVTDTASDAESKLLNLKVGGASKFSVRKDGQVNLDSILFSDDVLLTRIAEGDLSISNPESDQAGLYIYNLGVSGDTDYERMSIYASTGTTNWNILTEAGGAGSAGLLRFGAVGNASMRVYLNGADRWQFQANGSLTPYADASYDIGASSKQVRDLYLSRDIYVGTYTALGAESLAGYITIKDAGGTSRKIGVIA